jgi:hypothetical protein
MKRFQPGPTQATIQTYTGRLFNPFKPHLDDIDIRDIARALSFTCRFGGHVKWFYSVADHSILVTELLPLKLKLWGLLHDASEAYLSDMVRPLKHTVAMTEYRETEHVIQTMIYKKFGLTDVEPKDEIKYADTQALAIEMPAILEGGPNPGLKAYIAGIEIPKAYRARQIHYCDPAHTEETFLTIFNQLTEGKYCYA